MNRVAATINSNSNAKANTVDAALNQSGQPLEQGEGFMEGRSFSGFPLFKKGFDLAQVPAKPELQTGLRVQCCAKDGKPCSCPKCKAKLSGEDESAEAERFHNSSRVPSAQPSPDSDAETTSQSLALEAEDAVSTETSESDAGVAAAEQSRGLIVDDTSADLEEGQMKKTEFLQQLRAGISTTIEPVLATAGQTTDEFPYLDYWLNLYQQKNASEVEATVKKYAPESARATTAEEYISIVTQRALSAAEIWARTGRLTGMPEGVPTTIPGAPHVPRSTGSGSLGPAILAKAKEGGIKKLQEPATVQTQLGEGQQLSSDVRSRMESAFGTSFSHVRTHTDSVASGLSAEVNARAFTVGNHVAFAAGEYQPGTILGDALIAHELAHVVQQKSSAISVDKMEAGTAPYQALEADADKTALNVIGNLWAGAKGALAKISQTAVPRLRSGLQIQRCDRNAGPTPKSLRHVSTTNNVDPTYAYMTYITYEVLDTNGNPIRGFDVNEKFGTAVYDDATCNWRKSNEGGYTSTTTQFSDMMGGEANTYTPTPQNPQTPLGNHKVQHWPQEWYIGSTTPGRGVKVQTNTFQKYQDHANHENVRSPP